jgi:hypothetical protein
MPRASQRMRILQWSRAAAVERAVEDACLGLGPAEAAHTMMAKADQRSERAWRAAEFQAKPGALGQVRPRGYASRRAGMITCSQVEL